MEGLLLRLSMVDADAAAAVRVIAYFDALVEHRAMLAQLVPGGRGARRVSGRAAVRRVRTGPGDAVG